jgi:enamine deaminase RidA (YjgF/YER057c/UK114 family)
MVNSSTAHEQRSQPIRRDGRIPIMHRVVAHAGVLYFGGIVASDRSQPMEGQTLQVLEALDRLLEAQGSKRSKLLSVTIYLSDMTAKDEMNKIWTSWFLPEELPARATIGVADLGAGTLIEIVATAAM